MVSCRIAPPVFLVFICERADDQEMEMSLHAQTFFLFLPSAHFMQYEVVKEVGSDFY